MSVAADEIKAAQEKVGESVLSKVRSPNEASTGEEPPSGIQGKGTVDQPYDQGNQSAQAAEPGVVSESEPVSGQQGEGTADQPYDQGNQPEQTQSTGMSIIDELSRTKTKQEIEERKEKRRMSKAMSISQPSSSSQAQPEASTNGATPTIVEPSDAGRGRSETQTSTTSTAKNAPPSMKDMPKSERQIERSVSPGQLDDGRHVKCSGETGSSYAPPQGIGRLKGKLHIGGH